MISKERLQELIEKGATIYEAKYHNINPVDLSQKIRCINYKYGMILFEPSPKEKYLCHKYFKNLFETEEDARWELEMTATYTNTLKLPTWEEFEQKLDFNFIDKNGFNWDMFFDGEGIALRNGYGHFDFEYTKEGYIEACKLCLRLFKGEEV